MTKPLAVDLCCGLGGWSSGLIAEGWDVIGFDVERHVYGNEKYPSQLVLQDVLTLTGDQFRGTVALIVASPPCQFFSYVAMPWRRGKELAAKVRADPELLKKELALFEACERIGKEAGCPTIIENVRGAIPWVGRSRWNFGSFHLWGDVPALMPPTLKAQKVPGFRFDGSGGSFQSASVERHEGFKTRNMNWSDPSLRGQDFTRVAGKQADDEHIKLGGSWFHGYRQGQGPRNHGSNSTKRKAASAIIAKIPLPLSRWIGKTYYPTERAA